MGMTSTLARGLLAGAAGTAVLSAMTYADIALTGRPASTVPEETVTALLRRAGRPVPDGDRLTALGALSGVATGLAVGVAASVLRAAGVRLPAVLGAPVIGALAMAAADAPVAALGVSDPRTWTAAGWARDVVPHLAYGIGVRATLDATDRRRTDDGTDEAAPARRRGRLLGRSLLLGLAAGGRSSLGYVAAARLTAKPAATAIAGAAVLGEVAVDKAPGTPSRLEPGPLVGRAVAGGVGGFALARAQRSGVEVPALVGVGGAVVGSVLGAAWREIADRHGWGWPGAVAEDAASLALAWTALR
jgi:hypothetical protein